MDHGSLQDVRPPTAAGRFYPAEPEFLAKLVDQYLGSSGERVETPKAIIVPHAGYLYSGQIAGLAFRPWQGLDTVHRVIVIGPSHHYDFPGIALPDASVFATPLGELEIDRDAAENLLSLSFVRVFQAAHEPEHALEVQLPFIQRTFPDVRIVPLVTGAIETRQMERVIDQLWGGPETVLVISSDLSKYHDYATAKRYDEATAQLIEYLDYSKITADQACGFRAIRALLKAALIREMRCAVPDLRNSGDTAGVTSEITGFGAFHFFE